jgi:hypothetical protein
MRSGVRTPVESAGLPKPEIAEGPQQLNCARVVIEIPSSLLKNPEFVIPNGVCEVRNLSFLSILIEEGFLASLGMTAIRILQQPAREDTASAVPKNIGNSGVLTPEANAARLRSIYRTGSIGPYIRAATLAAT